MLPKMENPNITSTMKDGRFCRQVFYRDDGLAQPVEQVLNQILEAQFTEQLKARPCERTEEGKAARNPDWPAVPEGTSGKMRRVFQKE